MTTSIRTMWRRGKYVLLVGALAGSLAACGASGSSATSQGSSSTGHAPISASSAAADATAPATSAQQQLSQDGYALTPLPEFGHVVVGLASKSTLPRYELVYEYNGKNVALLDQFVTTAQQKLTGTQGVTLRVAGANKSLVVIQAANLSDLHTALKALEKSVK